MNDAYEVLEFHRIQEFLAEFSKTEGGKELIFSLSMNTDRNEVKHLLSELDEMIVLISRFGTLPLSSSVHIIRLIELAKKTALLTPNDLNHVLNDIEISLRLVNAFKNIDGDFPILREEISSISNLHSLELAIKKVITPSLTVSDNASSKLKEIRQKIRSLEASLNSKVSSLSYNYSTYLSDNNVTIRDGHFVLPVKTSYKNKVLGIIYDVSDSGNTTFIEPLEIVQLNNDITSKKLEENEEVRKILKELTALVLLQEDEVINNNNIISHLDFVSAKASYAISTDSRIASISDKQEVILKSSRHPLIDKNKVVSNDYYLDEEKRITVISGPNAGGKTVSLKTVGLLAYMNQCGLALPCLEARLGIFYHIYLDIGDGQSLSDNLSTFSSHMKNIASILEVTGKNDLVLLDELGTGTDPKEGEVIALSIIKQLEAKKSLAMISSHYSKIKEYAFMSSNVSNSSMLFDEEKLIPTYIYKYDVPGKSYGLEVATRYGIDKDHLEKVKNEYFKENNNDFDVVLSSLQKLIDENEKIRSEILIEKQNIEKEKKTLLNDSIRLKERKDDLLEEVKNEKDQILEELSEEVNSIIKQLSSGDLKLHEAINLKKKVEELKDSETIISYNEKIEVNDFVIVPHLGLEGKVTRINKNKAHLVCKDGMSVDVDTSLLHKIEENNEVYVSRRNNYYEDKINTSVGLELNIIGLHKDEAKDALIKYLDSCKVKNLKQVRIIHGFGSGVLRKMVHEYLSTLKGVKYRLGDASEGGGGATVVILHD